MFISGCVWGLGECPTPKHTLIIIVILQKTLQEWAKWPISILAHTA